MISILIGDNHVADRTGLAELLDTVDDLVLAGEAPSPSSAVRMARELQPDVVLMDLSSTGAERVQATGRIVADNPDIHVLVLTSFADPELLVDSLTAGADGYLLDNTEPEVILAAIRELVRSHTPLDPKAARVLLMRRRAAPPGVQLTGREWQVLRMVGDGQSNKAIARRLGITERTVKAHLTSVYHRLDVTDRTQAALWALRHRDGHESQLC